MPTPGSVAEMSSQQALPDMSSSEVKPEVKDEEDDGNSGKKQTDMKMEVCLRLYKRHEMHLTFAVGVIV